MTELIPRFYIGNWREAQIAPENFHVVTCMNDESGFCRNARFELVDGPGNEITLLIAAIEHVVKTYAEGATILVHCHGGRSRSATVSIASIAKIRCLSLCEAYDLVKDKHEITRVHPYLSKMLLELFHKE